MENRANGILCHITSLPSPFGIGDFGPGAYAFADFLAETKQSYWQVLPLNPTNADKGSSPFNSLSAFAGNILLVSPDVLREEGLLTVAESHHYHSGADIIINFQEVASFKQEMFTKAYHAFSRKKTGRGDYEHFCAENFSWLQDYATFAALTLKYEGKPITEWPEGVRDGDSEELRNVQEELRDTIEREKFLQYTFFRQWFSLKKYCNDKGIQIIGDFPFFMDCDSADVWVNPELFKVDSGKKSFAMAGSPPDHFAEKGQLFNCAVYNWGEMQKKQFSWWIARFEQMVKTFDILRIDHFRGFIAYWEVPAGEQTALAGKWQPVPYFDFMNTLLKHIPSLPIFAEDLGMITPDVREAMRTYNIPGIKMLLYGFAQEMRDDAFLPHNHITNSVVYTGTHDTNTCQGWFEKQDNPEDKELFAKYLGHEVQGEVNWEYIRMAMMSVAKSAIIPLQDVLGLGEEARMNTPGKADGNWRWRFKTKQITQPIITRLAEMTVIYGRS